MTRTTTSRPARLAVTTAYGAGADLEARARVVADRVGAPFRDRSQNLSRIRRETGADMLYVVGREREEVRAGRARLFVHAGMLAQRLRRGAGHPLARAIAPRGVDNFTRVLDGTLGLAGDALHIAALTGAEVEGFEASPVVACLLEDGLPRLARAGGRAGEAAARVRCRAVSADDGLGGETKPADAILFDPMFPAPRRGPHGYEVLREIAARDAVSERLLARALALAPRAVVKVPGGAPAPPCLRHARRISGRAVDYFVRER